MLVIRQAQLDALDDHAVSRFARSVLPAIRVLCEYRTRSYDDRSLVSLLEPLLRKARSLGLEGENDVLAFVLLALTIHDRFDEFPPYRDILKDPAIAAGDRMRTLLRTTSIADRLSVRDRITTRG
jgi:hypothetical protein